MDFSSALPTFVITLREGVEATLVVGIVLAYLKKARQSQLNSWVYGGVIGGLVASALVGFLFSWVIQSLGKAYPQYMPVIEPSLEAVFSVIAIAMLSWMLIWMTKQARFLKAEVEGAVTSALKQNNGAGWGIFFLIFIAVLREGFETVLFILSQFQQGLIPMIGAISGVGVAAGLGVLLFKWGIRINIRQFFQIMGVILLLVVAGLVISALNNFDQAIATLAQMNRQSEGLCFYYERFTKNPSCVLGPVVWDLTKSLPDDKFPGVVFKALFGYHQRLYLVQAVSYVVFLLTIGGIYFREFMNKSASPAKKTA